MKTNKQYSMLETKRVICHEENHAYKTKSTNVNSDEATTTAYAVAVIMVVGFFIAIANQFISW